MIRPRVLFLIDQLKSVGGAERALMRLTAALAERDTFVSVVTLGDRVSPELNDWFPCEAHALGLFRTYDFDSLRKAVVLRSLIKRMEINIVSTYFESSDLWGAPIAKLCGCKVVSCRRDMGILRQSKHKVAYRFASRIFDRVVAVSDEVRHWTIRADALPPHKILTIHNGVPIPKAAGKARSHSEFKMPPTAFVITMVGNVRPEKGTDVLVRAAEQVCTKLPNARFLVVGGVANERYAEHVSESIAKAGLTDKIVFSGHQEDVTSILRMSDLFVLPSRSEGFSNALLEAMAVGLPCVATRVGGNSEALGTAGVLVDPEDATGLAFELIHLAQDADLRSRLGAAARLRAEANFSVDAMANKMLAAFYEVLNDGVEGR